MTSDWLAQRVPAEGVHVIPVADSIEHEVGDCVCGPRTEAVFTDEGACNWLTVHHSLDGREQSE